jgi:hypothetical protein
MALQELSEDIGTVIDAYLDGHRSRSLATLARASGVPYTTVRRFWQREGAPTAAPVIKILDATIDTATRAEFIGRHFPEIARSVERFAGSPARLDAGERLDLKDFFHRDPHGLILMLAFNKSGTTVEQIRRLCGAPGERALDDLVAAGAVETIAATGQVKCNSDLIVSLDPTMILAWIRMSMQRFDVGLLGTKSAKLCHTSGGVSRGCLDKIHAIASEAIHQITELKEDPANAGDIPFFFAAMLNVYDR